MKNLKACFFIILVISLSTVSAQELSFEEKVKVLSERIEKITAEERAELKDKIRDISKRLDQKEITEQEAQQLKKSAAEESAKNIQSGISSIEEQLHALIQNKVDDEIFTESNKKRFRVGAFDVDYDHEYDWHGHRRHRPNRRTTSNFVFAFGLNNLVSDTSLNSIDDSEFNFWSSHFLEWGFSNKTRVFKNNGLVYINYGFSVMYNKLKPKSNQYFVAEDNATGLEVHPIDLDKSKFKNVQLVLPVMLELDFSRPRIDGDDEKIRYRTNKGLRIGAGGFLGLNLKTKQTLKYKEDDIKVKEIQKGDFNTNNFVYGLSGFIGYKDTSFYVKYDLNELFNDQIVPQNNISFGIRFDW